MNYCPRCKKALVNERDKFCDQCGCNLQQSKMRLTDENTDPNQVKPTPTVQSSRRIERLINTESEPSEVGLTNPTRKTNELTSQPIALSINTNQFYMQGFSGVIHLKVENLTDESLNVVTLKVLGNVQIKNNSWHFKLLPHESKERKLQLTPPMWKGNELIQFKMAVTKGCTTSIYEAQATLYVLEKIDDVKEIELHTGNIDFGQESRKFNLGGVINVDVKNMIEHGEVKNANELILEYEKLVPAFRPIHFEFMGTKHLYSLARGWRLLIFVALIALGLVVIVSFLLPHGEKKTRQTWQEALSARLELESLQVSPNQYIDSLYKEAEQSLRQGEESFNRGDYPQAEKFFEVAKQKFEKAKDIVDAKQSAEKELYIPGDDTTKLLDEAKTYMNRGFLDGAHRAVKQILSEHPENKQAKQLLAEINERIKQKEQRDSNTEQIDQWWKN
jgi:tetratricopeptide (TPR) repeat protein